MTIQALTSNVPARRTTTKHRTLPLRPRVLVASSDDSLRCYLADHLWVDGADVVEIARCPAMINDVIALESAMDPADLVIGDARMMRLGALVALSNIHSGGAAPRMLLLVPGGEELLRDDEDEVVVLAAEHDYATILLAARQMLKHEPIDLALS